MRKTKERKARGGKEGVGNLAGSFRKIFRAWLGARRVRKVRSPMRPSNTVSVRLSVPVCGSACVCTRCV